MTQEKCDSQTQKPKISLLAICSLVLAISAFVQAVLSFTIWPTMGAVVLCMLLIVISVSFGIFSMLALLLMNKFGKNAGGAKIILVSILAPIVLFFLLGPTIDLYKRLSWENVSCSNSLSNIARAIYMYGQENNGKYPQPDKWCDLLSKYDDPNRSFFICQEAQKHGDMGPCHFAINPNCGPNSPPDTILIFETKGGWNQYGGLEKMCFDHHRIKVANYLLNDGPFNFACTTGAVKPKDTSRLNWGDKQKPTGLVEKN